MLDDRNWVKACDAKKVGREDVARWDHSGRSFAIFRTADINITQPMTSALTNMLIFRMVS